MSDPADDEMATGEVDPKAFLASLLRLSPQDAKRVRDATPPPKRVRRKHDDDSEHH
jgi:hypothetical protein